MLFVASEQLTMTLVLFLKCSLDIQTVLLLFFVVVVLSALAVHVLYWKRMGDEYNVDTFLDSFMAMIIFLESQDNWDAVVVPAYRVSKWGSRP